MPESQIILSQACTYVATAPKSNTACVGIEQALSYVSSHRRYQVPPYLKDAHYDGAAKLERGIGYKYAHNYKNHYVNQQYLPDEVVGNVFYNPSDNGYEQKIKEHLERIRSEAEE